MLAAPPGLFACLVGEELSVGVSGVAQPTQLFGLVYAERSRAGDR